MTSVNGVQVTISGSLPETAIIALLNSAYQNPEFKGKWDTYAGNDLELLIVGDPDATLIESTGGGGGNTARIGTATSPTYYVASNNGGLFALDLLHVVLHEVIHVIAGYQDPGDPLSVQIGISINDNGDAAGDVVRLTNAILGGPDRLSYDGIFGVPGALTDGAGAGNDQGAFDLTASLTGGATIDIAATTRSSIVDLTQLNGSRDLIVGRDASESIKGGGGDDFLYGQGGIDRLAGDEGSDQLHGGEGNDTLIGGAGNDLVHGGYKASGLAAGIADGFDIADYSRTTIGVYATSGIELSANYDSTLLYLNDRVLTVTGGGSVGTDSLVSIEKIIATRFTDHFAISGTPDEGSVLHVDASGDAPADPNEPEPENDTIELSHTEEGFFVNSVSPTALVIRAISGGGAVSIENFHGSIAGTDFSDVIIGNADEIHGGDGADFIAASDYAFGGAGADRITGGVLVDGGAGNDYFEYTAGSWIVLAAGGGHDLVDPENSMALIDIGNASFDSLEIAWERVVESTETYDLEGLGTGFVSTTYSGRIAIVLNGASIAFGSAYGEHDTGEYAAMVANNDPNPTPWNVSYDVPMTIRNSTGEISFHQLLEILGLTRSTDPLHHLEPNGGVAGPNFFDALNQWEAGYTGLDINTIGQLAEATSGDDQFVGGGASFDGAADGLNIDLTISGQQDTGGSGLDYFYLVGEIIGSAFADVIRAIDKDIYSAIAGGDGDDHLFGNNQNDSLSGDAGSDLVEGGDGDDSISGGFGSDVLIGGLKGDYLQGDEGADTYIYQSGDGSDFIYDSPEELGTIDTLHFSDLTVRGVHIAESGADIVLTIVPTGITVTIQEGMSSSGAGIERIEFSDSTSLSAASIRDRASGSEWQPVNLGTDDGDFLSGTLGDDVLVGLLGEDVFEGSVGDDIVFGGGVETDQVNYNGSFTDYFFDLNGDGSVSVSKPGGGTDILHDIDGLWFSGDEEWVSMEDALSGGSMGRMYSSTFDFSSLLQAAPGKMEVSRPIGLFVDHSSLPVSISDWDTFDFTNDLQQFEREWSDVQVSDGARDWAF